ncbi:nicotinate phosphoribosyltransferase [Thermoflavifilum aggregans]|uniref:Nicotinate phosphoribosyltransferase n=1 Tax=Thermoflavifilum aggregans TaxID=454188 RepID=A0A2M9CVR7_9BACT|nr:nicotinate phosphoribosyltransferase [Thermoflavifilum aggregans]PJJ75985.1 nicotinate phosphoribosyltransferase [Thermoflavifilum aggregans]
MNTYSITGSYTDLYELVMAQAYFLENRHHTPAVFDYFFRKIPFDGGYVIFAGLHELLDILEEWTFSEQDIDYLRETLHLHPDFLDYVREFRFNGNIYACREGEVVFPFEPVVRVEASILEAQMLETLLLNILNFQSLIATKAARIRYVSGDKVLSEFGFRRAQGLAGIMAARAAVIGGFQSTSNVYAGERYGIPVVGTMAHSFVQSYESELAAFRAFARHHPQDCIFLVDTYDTLHSGIPNAIAVAKEMEQEGKRALGIRLDSGDLAYLSRKARTMLDEAGLTYMKIVVSNQLDEYLIRSLHEQGAPIDIFGVGTKLAIGHPDAVLDGVYKLSEVNHLPTIKLSESLTKMNLPGKKQVFRVLNSDAQFLGADVIAAADENEAELSIMHHPFEPGKSKKIKGYPHEPLLFPVMKNGKSILPRPALQEIAAYARKRLQQLPPEYKRFEFPHAYKVGLSEKLLQLRDQLRAQYQHSWMNHDT